MAAVLEKQARRWTYEEYYKLDDDQRNAGIIQRRAIFGTPDLLVELISPSSVRRDRYEKKDLYARFGVKEYWIGDPANKALEILTLKEGRYELHYCAEEKGKLASLVLAGLEFDLSDIQ